MLTFIFLGGNSKDKEGRDDRQTPDDRTKLTGMHWIRSFI